jgi:hypothetical protein
MAIGAILGGISAVTGIAGSIFGAQQQSRNEAAARDAEQERVDAINEYNKRRFEDDKENFFLNREFNWNQAVRKYEYETQIQLQQFRGQVDAYKRDQQNLANQLYFNQEGERMAYLREQNVMRETRDEQTFGRAELYIDTLKNKAAASAARSGRSTDRGIMMALAEQGRKLSIMDASYTGAIREHNINMFDIAMQKTNADDAARGRTMIAPVTPIPLIKPQETPIPKFTEPAEAIAGFVPSSSAVATVLGGISSGLNSLSGLDFTNPNPAPSGVPSGYGFIGSNLASSGAFSSGGPFANYGSNLQYGGGF